MLMTRMPLKLIACTVTFLPMHLLGNIPDWSGTGIFNPRSLFMFWAGMAYLGACHWIDRNYPDKA